MKLPLQFLLREALAMAFLFGVLSPAPSALAGPYLYPGPLGGDGTWGVRTYLNQGTAVLAEDLAATLAFLTDPATASRTPATSPTNTFDAQLPYLNCSDPQTNGPGGVLTCWPIYFPGNTLADDDHVITVAHATMRIDVEDDYTFNAHSDDGFLFIINAVSGPDPVFSAVGGPGSISGNQMSYPVGTGDADTRGVIHLTPGFYNLEYVHWEGVGGFFYQLTAARGAFPNNGDTTAWSPVGAVASLWDASQQPSILGQWTVQSTAAGGSTTGSLAGADAAVTAAVAADSVAATSTWDSINFTDPETGGANRGLLGGVLSPWPRNTAVDDDNYAIRMSATLHIPSEGDYLFGYEGDDGSKLAIGGTNPGFTTLLENASGATTIGRLNTIAANSGSLGAAVNFTPATSALFEQPGALAGSPDTAVSSKAADAQKLEAPFNAALNPSGPFTIEAWLNPAVVNGAGVLTCAVASGEFASPRSGWLIYQSDTGWNFRTYNQNGTAVAVSITGGSAPVVGTWYHVAATWDGSVGKIFVNGVLSATSGATTFVANVDGPFHVGSRSDSAFGWEGSADEVAFYGSALDAATLLSHYSNGTNAGRPTPYPTLVAASSPLGYWRLNEVTQPRVELGTLFTDIPTGNSSTVGRIHLLAGNYPISALFYEIGGGSAFQIFCSRDYPRSCVPYIPLQNGTLSLPPYSDGSGLPIYGSQPVQVVSFLVSGDAVNIVFASSPGLEYKIESSLDLVTWTLQDFATGEAGATTHWVNSLTALGLNTEHRVLWRVTKG